jgi:hypothetical protein
VFGASDREEGDNHHISGFILSNEQIFCTYNPLSRNYYSYFIDEVIEAQKV